MSLHINFHSWLSIDPVFSVKDTTVGGGSIKTVDLSIQRTYETINLSLTHAHAAQIRDMLSATLGSTGQPNDELLAALKELARVTYHMTDTSPNTGTQFFDAHCAARKVIAKYAGEQA